MSDRRCPECGYRVPDASTKRQPGETFCTPITCICWTVTAKFNHGTREWEATDEHP